MQLRLLAQVSLEELAIAQFIFKMSLIAPVPYMGPASQIGVAAGRSLTL